MARLTYEATYREGQVAMSLLAHAARHDAKFIAESLKTIADRDENVRPLSVMAVLLAEFSRGIDDNLSAELAEHYMAEAATLAAKAA